MYIIICIMILGMIVLVKSSHQSSNQLDKNATLPLRGILAILIVLNHLALVGDVQEITPPHLIDALFQFRQLAPYVVGMFFFLTGYGLHKSLLSKGDAYIKDFPKKRFMAIMPSFIISIIFFQIVLCISGDLNPSGIITEISKGKTSHLLPYCWFVIIVTIVYILFYLSSIASNNRTLRAVLFTFNITMLSTAIRMFKFESYWYISLAPILVGYFYAIYEDKINKFTTRILITLIGITASLALSYHWLFSEILMIISPIVVMYILHKIGKTNNKSLQYLGKISYELYLVHGIVIYTFKFIPDFYVFSILVFSVSVFAALMLNYITNKIQLFTQ